jgi:uncharacterized membrane protein
MILIHIVKLKFRSVNTKIHTLARDIISPRKASYRKDKIITVENIENFLAWFFVNFLLSGVVISIVGFLLFIFASFIELCISIFTFIWNDSSIFIRIPIAIIAIGCCLLAVGGVIFCLYGVYSEVSKIITSRKATAKLCKYNKYVDEEDDEDTKYYNEWLNKHRNREKHY